MNRVIHFEIPAENPEKLVNFYKNVFNWEITKWEGPQEYWIVKTGDNKEPGIDGAIVRAVDDIKSIVNTIDVPDVDSYIVKIIENGGEILFDKMTIPNVGQLAYARDCEGTVFGIIQNL